MISLQEIYTDEWLSLVVYNVYMYVYMYIYICVVDLDCVCVVLSIPINYVYALIKHNCNV